MAETDLHRTLMSDLIETLKLRYAADPNTYVSGNLLIFYEPGNKRRHISPDVFVVTGVSNHQRLNYLVWEEGKGPDVVIELTSKTTRREDRTKKWRLYQEVLRVPEYFLFDPYSDYLKPSFQGYRLRHDAYVPLEPMAGVFHSDVLDLDLVRQNHLLRLREPGGEMLLTPSERIQAAESRVLRTEQHARKVEEDNERLRRELEELRRFQSPGQ